MKSQTSLLVSFSAIVITAFTFHALRNEVTAFTVLPPSSRTKWSSIQVRPMVGASPSGVASSASNIDGSTKSTDTASSSMDPSSPIGFVHSLLSTLSAAPTDSDGFSKGQSLLEASSESWRRAIYQAIGAPPDVKNTQGVAKALQDAMARPNNQFAVLMGSDGTEPFVATFPSDVVDYRGDGTTWLECRLRHATTDELLVTIGVQLISEQEQWKILTLDWQDFRPQFYPGLSGREWLRSF